MKPNTLKQDRICLSKILPPIILRRFERYTLPQLYYRTNGRKIAKFPEVWKTQRSAKQDIREIIALLRWHFSFHSRKLMAKIGCLFWQIACICESVRNSLSYQKRRDENNKTWEIVDFMWEELSWIGWTEVWKERIKDMCVSFLNHCNGLIVVSEMCLKLRNLKYPQALLFIQIIPPFYPHITHLHSLHAHSTSLIKTSMGIIFWSYDIRPIGLHSVVQISGKIQSLMRIILLTNGWKKDKIYFVDFPPCNCIFYPPSSLSYLPCSTTGHFRISSQQKAK